MRPPSRRHGHELDDFFYLGDSRVKPLGPRDVFPPLAPRLEHIVNRQFHRTNSLHPPAAEDNWILKRGTLPTLVGDAQIHIACSLPYLNRECDVCLLNRRERECVDPTIKISGLAHSVRHTGVYCSGLDTLLVNVFVGRKSKHASTEIHQLSGLLGNEGDVDFDRRRDRGDPHWPPLVDIAPLAGPSLGAHPTRAAKARQAAPVVRWQPRTWQGFPEYRGIAKTCSTRNLLVRSWSVLVP